ncbi:hypothetical protein KR038_006329, partial [Drosophila bunnanda]
MSFTLTSQSVIRFESSTARLRDEWLRTLMFFNVDLSGGVHCDHRNEITQDRNGKRELINEICEASTDSSTDSNTFAGRNPGGGLSNSIRECAMPFGKQNEFYAQSRDDLGHRGLRGLRSRLRSLGGRRRNSSYCGSRRHYSLTKPRWKNHAIDPFSHFPTQNSTHRYVSPEYDTDNAYEKGYNNRCSPKAYHSDEYELPSHISRDFTYPENAHDSRDGYDPELCTDFSYESPRDYYDNERLYRGTYQRSYEPLPYRDYSPYYTDELSCNDLNINGRESLSQLNIFKRVKQRQASGSMLPEYALNYNDNYHNERYDSDYEDRYEDTEGSKVRYSPQKRFGYDYGKKRLRSPPIISPKPRGKIRSDYKIYRDKGYSINQSRNYKTDLPGIQSRHSHKPGSHRNRSRESGSCHRNRSRRQSYLEKIFAPYKKSREMSAHNNRISRQTLSHGSHIMHENYPKLNLTVPRRTPEKRKPNFLLEEIPQPFKKYIRKEVPLSNYHLSIDEDDEIPRRQRNLVSEPSVSFGNISSSKLYDQNERRSNLNISSNKKKLFDFGSEIPHRIWKSATPSPMPFSLNIPFKRKRSRTMWAYLNDIDSDSSYEHVVPQSDCAKKRTTFKPRVSLYEVKCNHPSRSIKQKISGFLKMSKKNFIRSNSFKGKKKKSKNQCQDDQEKGKGRSGPKKSDSGASKKTKINSTSEPKESISVCIKTRRCISKIGSGSHYPTVFRGKCRNENDELNTCTTFCSNRCSKSDHGEQKLYRISSGNCSLNNDGKKNEPVNQSEKNHCQNSQDTGSLTGSLKIIASNTVSSHGSNDDSSEDGSESSNISIPIPAILKENQFRSVRFSPTPSYCHSSSSTSSSSENSSIRGVIVSNPNQIKRQGIETCPKTPTISKSISSEVGCTEPRRRICANWSLTQKSCSSHQSNHNCIESNSGRPSRPGLCLPNNIELSSRPPMIQRVLNMKSSLKTSNNKLDGTTLNKKVCLNINSSSSGLS